MYHRTKFEHIRQGSSCVFIDICYVFTYIIQGWFTGWSRDCPNIGQKRENEFTHILQGNLLLTRININANMDK